jgi:hypothetical protein
MAAPFYTRHDGPYRLQVTRRDGQGHTTTAVLPVEYSGPDAESSSFDLIQNQTETVISVSVWSLSEQQHVMTYRAGDRLPAPAVAAPAEPAPSRPSAPVVTAGVTSMAAAIANTLSPAQKAWITRRAKQTTR